MDNPCFQAAHPFKPLVTNSGDDPDYAALPGHAFPIAEVISSFSSSIGERALVKAHLK